MNVEIDKFHLLTLVGEDTQAVAEILNEFLESGLESLDKMALAITQKGEAEFRASVHQLKGASSMFGMKTVCSICLELENSAFDEVDGNFLIRLRAVFVRSHQLATDVLVG